MHGYKWPINWNVRAIPATFWSAPWYRKVGSTIGPRSVIPQSLFKTLSPQGQRVAAGFASATEDIDVHWGPDWQVVGPGHKDKESKVQRGLVVGKMETVPKL